MSFLSVVLTLDPLVVSLGRIDIDSISDQTRMELVFAEATDGMKEVLQNTDGEFLDIGKWAILLTDSDGNVTEVNIDNAFMRTNGLLWKPLGTLHLEYVPSTVKKLAILFTNFHGSLDTASLPLGLQELRIHSTKLTGIVALESLPGNLQKLILRENNFVGSVQLSSLPQTLLVLDLRRNAFDSSACLDHLPNAIEIINISVNKLTGTIPLGKLPIALTYFDVSSNNFSGELALDDIPKNLEHCFLDKNNFTGSISFASLKALKTLNVADNQLIGKALLPGVATDTNIFLFGNSIDGVLTVEGHLHSKAHEIQYESDIRRQIVQLQKQVIESEVFKRL